MKIGPRDSNGYKDTLRLLVHMQDEVEVFTEKTVSTELRAEEARVKNPSLEQLEQLQASVDKVPADLVELDSMGGPGGSLARSRQMFLKPDSLGVGDSMASGFSRAAAAAAENGGAVGQADLAGSAQCPVASALAALRGTSVAAGTPSGTPAPSTPFHSGR